MKLKAPLGCHAASHRGRSIAIAEDGTIDADEESAAVFIAHGFRLAEADGQEQAGGAEPAGHARRSERMAVEPVSDVPGIESLSRRELFALLRAKGVSVTLPITNSELRDAARRACAG